MSNESHRISTIPADRAFSFLHRAIVYEFLNRSEVVG